MLKGLLSSLKNVTQQVNIINAPAISTGLHIKSRYGTATLHASLCPHVVVFMIPLVLVSIMLLPFGLIMFQLILECYWHPGVRLFECRFAIVDMLVHLCSGKRVSPLSVPPFALVIAILRMPFSLLMHSAALH